MSKESLMVLIESWSTKQQKLKDDILFEISDNWKRTLKECLKRKKQTIVVEHFMRFRDWSMTF